MKKYLLFTTAIWLMSSSMAAYSEGISPVITSLSTDFISVTSETPYDTTIAVYGTDLGYLLDPMVSIEIGPLIATSVAGNSTGMNLTFPVDAAAITDPRASYSVVIKNAGDVVFTSTQQLELYNPYKLAHESQRTKRFLNKTRHGKQATKRTVGLNVHWALGSGTDTDANYAEKIDASKTKWAREHISYESIMGEDSAAWLKRYDRTMLRYTDRRMRVVAMLAYGEAGNEFAPPSTQNWKDFVELVTQRYGNYVDVWEVWNEPDSPTYLTPNTWQAYKPLLRSASTIIRRNDPDAMVLNGAISDITHQDFIRKLYAQGRRYFDELNVHLYYCDEYRDDGESLGHLATDWESLRALVKKYRKAERIWITELGCSTGLTGVDDKMARRYIKRAVKQLRQTPRLRPVFLYTFRDRDYLNPYEANFGLLKEDFTNKPSWNWYRKLKQS